jgi:hypothetical protein
MPQEKKGDWPTVGARIRPEEYDKLKQKHSKRGEINRVIHALVKMYLSNRIYGINLKEV